MGVYTLHLTKALNKIEETCGLHLLNDQQVKITNLTIKDFIKEFDLSIASYSQKEVSDLNIKIGRYMPGIAYLNYRMQFFDHTRLDFSNHHRIDLVLEVLSKFTREETITKDTKREIALIIEHLSVLEGLNKMYISSLAYRYLRLFIILLILANYADAKVIAELIISQVLIAEDYYTEETDSSKAQ